MSLEGYVQSVVELVRDHEAWAAPIVFALAFGESLAFVSLVLPAWAALVAIGALLGAGDAPIWPVWAAGAAGAAAGDWLSYWLGLRFGPRIERIWPLSRHPGLVPRGHRFMLRWGVAGVFVGRFFGPLRAAVPLAAGLLEMPFWRFQAANVSSAIAWAWVLLSFGDFGWKAIGTLF